MFRPELFPLHPYPATLYSHLHFYRVDFLVLKKPSTSRQTVVSHSSPLSTRTHSHPHTSMHINMPCFHRSQSSHLTVCVSSSLSSRWKTFSPNLQFFRLGSWFGCGSRIWPQLCLPAPASSKVALMCSFMSAHNGLVPTLLSVPRLFPSPKCLLPSPSLLQEGLSPPSI